jgi:hypothetical protein
MNQGKGLEYLYGDLIGPGPFTFLPFLLLKDGRRFYLRYRWPLVPGQPGRIAPFRFS